MSNESISINKSLSWVGLSQVCSILFQFLGVAVLARLLLPSDYGLMAMVVIVINFTSLFRDFGTGSAIIQKEKIDAGLINAVFTFNIIIGLTLTFFLIVISTKVAEFFSEPRLLGLLLAISPVFLIASLGIAHKATIERSSNFKTLAFIDFFGALLALMSAIFVAWLGWGVYALVIQNLVLISVTTFLIWNKSTHKIRISLRLEPIKEIWKYSGNLFLFGCVNYFQRNADSMLIGKLLGSVELGIYNIAYKILLLPLQNITYAINRVSLPEYSRSQNDKKRIGRHYLNTIQNISFITVGLMALIWANREIYVLFFLGEGWTRSADLLFWLAPVGFLQSMVSTSGSILSSIGRTDILRNLGLVGAFFLVGSIVVGMNWGINGVACAYFLANLVWVYPVMKTVLSQLGFSFLDFLREVYKYVITGILLAFFFRFSIANYLDYNLPIFFHVVISSFTFLVLYMLLTKLFWPSLVVNGVSYFLKMLPRNRILR